MAKGSHVGPGKKWQAECDARTIAEAKVIMSDPSRMKAAASAARCLKCNKKLGEVWRPNGGAPVYEGLKGNFTFEDGRIYQTCGGCGTKYQVRELGAGWALIGRDGSKIFE